MQLEKYKRWINFILIGAMMLTCLVAFHDMQTAEGVGFYFSLKLGLEQRLPMDLLVDVLGIAALAVLCYLPCKCLKYTSLDSYVRFFIGYLAVVPSLSLARVMALFQPEQNSFLFDRGFLVSWEGWRMIYSLLPFLQVWVPVCILVYAILKINQKFVCKKWHKVLLVMIVVPGILLFIVPMAESLLLYLMGYLGLLLAFDLWEKLYEEMPQLRKWYLSVFVLLLLKGIYRIVVLMSQF